MFGFEYYNFTVVIVTKPRSLAIEFGLVYTFRAIVTTVIARY